MITLDFDDADAELAASLRRFCDETSLVEEGTDLSRSYWKGLADLGVLGLATREGGGGATTIAAAMEVLGRADAPGPLAATFVAGQLVDDAARGRIASGDDVVSVGSALLFPWLPVAEIVIELDGSHAHLATVSGDIEEVQTLGGEPWGRARVERLVDLGDAHAALAVGNVAIAAFLAGSGARALEDAAAYAGDRVQFRQSIGSFQAVAHPMAEAYIRLTAARTLARCAAFALDNADPAAASAAATARLSASKAAMAAAFHCHQAYGALGFTVEGPLGTRSARIRQVAMLPPNDGELRATALVVHGITRSTRSTR